MQQAFEQRISNELNQLKESVRNEALQSVQQEVKKKTKNRKKINSLNFKLFF